MFGKGLESLIPPQDSDNNDSYSSPTAPQGDTADEPLEAYLKENTAPIEIPHTEEATISEPQGEPTPDSSFVPVPGTGDEKIEGAIFQIERPVVVLSRLARSVSNWVRYSDSSSCLAMASSKIAWAILSSI